MEHESNAIDPMGDFERSHSCDAISANLIDHEVVLAGWVQRRRDHGGVIFVDLRDRTGVIQVVFRPDASSKAHARAGALRSEFVLAVRGVIKHRSEETINLDIPNGDIEVVAADLALLNTASPPPFAIEDDPGVDESVRLQHRIHDLRRGPLQKNLSLRHRLTKAIRDTLCENEFTEIETPILTKSTPEGARDFLVPARQQPGEFYALPQSPQLMKQLLMIAGFERYFQIARCFRDEDQRADRQLEFTQVDLEMSFVKVENILKLLEEITWKGCLEAKGVELQRLPELACGQTSPVKMESNDRVDHRGGERDAVEESQIEERVGAARLVAQERHERDQGDCSADHDACVAPPQHGSLDECVDDAEQEQHGQQHCRFPGVEAKAPKGHDGYLEELDFSNEARFFELVGDLPCQGRKQEKRQDKYARGSRYYQLPLGIVVDQLVDDENYQGILENVVVEGT